MHTGSSIYAYSLDQGLNVAEKTTPYGAIYYVLYLHACIIAVTGKL